jgi:hypothetical protein
VVWALGVEIYELSTYHFPHIEVSTFLCEACKKLIHGVWYEKPLLHDPRVACTALLLLAAFASSHTKRSYKWSSNFAAMLISSAR